MQASYQPTDLCALTSDLASSFRSTSKRPDCGSRVDCPPLPQPVYVDRDMWEKIVLNLISNAFKYTFEGEIAVEIQPSADGTAAMLQVRDTGTGIAAEELPRLFERFHRVEGARGRTHEGTGIGLALVQELVKLHGGSVGVESELGKGSTFTVSVPFGVAHLPRERIGAASALVSTATRADTYVEEAERWLPLAPLPSGDGRPPGPGGALPCPAGRRQRRHARVRPPPARVPLRGHAGGERAGCAGPGAREARPTWCSAT